MALEIGDSQIERNQNLAAGANLKRKREHRKDKTDNNADRKEKKKKKKEINGERNGHGDTNVTVDEDNNKTKKREKKEGHTKNENTSLGDSQQDGIAEEGKKKKKKKKRNGEKIREHEDNVPNTDEQDVEPDKKKRKRERKRQREANENALEEDAQQADAEMEQTEETNGAVETTSVKSSKKKKRRDQQEAHRTSTTTDATSSRSSTSVSCAEVSEYLAKHGVTIDCGSGSLPSNLTPILSFSSLLPHLPEPLHNAFDSFKEPTPIQACSWPASLDGRDVVGIAETGSGKTLAFGVPAIAHMARHQNDLPPSSKKSKSKHGNKKSQAQVLVVAPTRELALQTHETFTELGKPFGLTSVAVYGGVDKDPQRRALSQVGAAMVVGTPGRILDLVNEGACDLSGVTYLVLDEADRMLDKGFENDIRAIIAQCAPSKQRQTLMFSATWPDAVRRLASTFQRNPVRITVGSDDLTANRRVEQVVEVFDDQYEKDSRLLSHLQKLKPQNGRSNTQSHSQPQDDTRILVFVLYKKEATRVEQTLLRHKFSVSSIHGDLSQSARISALENFKKGETQILVATDVAARGLDIPSVGLVLNYSFPLTVEDYVHRIGRTGRGGRSGKSITFFTGDNHEKALAGELAKVMREGGFDASPLKKFPMTIKKKEHGVYGAFYRDDIPASATPTHMKF
ncbi:DEAD-domain-containing protein [Fomitiporia mediterranea MF3/22]|uniref:DEAD-domain-containing protein n=1 Tax=Fomitiporia mediterranea (strain MF3/22) TaxID=694068 RepID=UPI00044085CF|nr:DEAD-domain-containing protein [Fomitiporia mediterranea MF3/22]EJD04466.1 DEAD-domain-containing protein [Fomitiporia mediterranea MF3/22]